MRGARVSREAQRLLAQKPVTAAVPATAPAHRRAQILTLGVAVLLALLVLLSTQANASAAPSQLEREGGNWQRWGSGEMRWLGFELYRATLWVSDVDGDITQSPHALVLHYRRAISATRLADASIDEMRKLGIAEENLQRWQPELLRVFRDVREGDSITGVHRPGSGASFYHGMSHTGDVADPDFAAAFFAIWLDPRTSEPKLRKALLQGPIGKSTRSGSKSTVTARSG